MKKILLLLLLPIITFAQKEVIVHINTDQYPSETRWVLHADSLYGTILQEVNYGYYNQSYTSYSDTFYIPDTITNVTFIIWDSYGDGMSGSYYVDICNDTIISNPAPSFSYGYYHNRVVPQCMPNPPPEVSARVVINLDQYQSETSWDIKDTSGIIYASGGGYYSQPDYATVIENINIPKGDLIFTIYDTYGDGLNGALWQGQDGSYYVIQCNDTLIYGTDAAFGYDTAHVFVSDSCPPIYGCMDNDYVEFNPYADVDDGSCQVLKIFGCLDSTMFNYDPSANTMDLIDTCTFKLVLHDLMGNGWVGSHLKLIHPDTTYQFTHNGTFDDVHYVGLTAPDPITLRFHISSQASLTTIECGFTLINPEGDTMISIQPPFIQPLLPYNLITNCGNTCEEKVYGCLDLMAVNYDSLANTSDSSCYYVPGCTNSSYLEYYTQGFTADFNDGSCLTEAIWGCTDSLAFNYDTIANIDNGGCIPVIAGCMQALAFNYNPNANTPDTCIAIVYGCMSSIALNYNPAANTDDGSCIGVVYGCTDTLAFNWNPNANVDDDSCIPVIYGCINPVMFNYCDTCNTNDGSCIEILYGCIDSTMFNYNPLANVDNNSCIPFIYGCTNPSMLNYNPDANTEDFSCIPYIYGCMDSTALNYDSLANTDNGSCITIVEGCMDQSAYNYDILANVHDSTTCLYAAPCATGPGNPFWLNDPCYAWVILVDDYCCENAWDEICQLTYNYCDSTYTGPIPTRESLGNEIIVYPNPTSDKININKNVDINVFNYIGDMIISKNNINVLDMSKLSSGMYTLQIIYKNKSITKQLIKK
jgi:hypothetical protein